MTHDLGVRSLFGTSPWGSPNCLRRCYPCCRVPLHHRGRAVHRIHHSGALHSLFYVLGQAVKSGQRCWTWFHILWEDNARSKGQVWGVPSTQNCQDMCFRFRSRKRRTDITLFLEGSKTSLHRCEHAIISVSEVWRAEDRKAVTKSAINSELVELNFVSCLTQQGQMPSLS